MLVQVQDKQRLLNFTVILQKIRDLESKPEEGKCKTQRLAIQISDVQLDLNF